MLKLNLYKNKISTSKNFGRVYGRVDYDSNLMDLTALAKHIASHGSVYTADVILGVMNKMAYCIKELALEGKKIKLGDLAIFYATVKSKGADSYLGFNINTHVEKVRLAVRGTGDTSVANMTSSASIGYSSLAESLRDAERPQPDPDDDDDDNG